MSFAEAFDGSVGLGTICGDNGDQCGVYVNQETKMLTMGKCRVLLTDDEVKFMSHFVFSKLLFPHGVSENQLCSQIGDNAVSIVEGLRAKLRDVSIANDGGDGGTYISNGQGEHIHLPTFHEYTVTADMLMEPTINGYVYRSDLASLIDQTHEISEQDLDRLRLKAPASIFTLSF